MDKKYSLTDEFNYIDGELSVGRIKITELHKQMGGSPFYVYDKRIINDRIQYLRTLLPSTLKISYSVKANPFKDLLRFLVPLVEGFDVASRSEFLNMLDLGVSSKEISYAGPGKRAEDIELAVLSGITIVIESEEQLKKTIFSAEKLGLIPNIALRINPKFSLKGSGLKMAGVPSQFGIDEDLIPGFFSMIRSANVKLVGFHLYGGTQCLDAKAIVEFQRNSFDLVKKISDLYDDEISWIKLGGGFGVPYYEGERPLEMELISENLYKICEKSKNELNAKVDLELGRYLVATSGIYVCQILDIKRSCGKNFIVCDGGLNHHLAATGNFGQVFRKNYPIFTAKNLSEKKTDVYCIVGPLCTSIDILADGVYLSPPNIGDLIVVCQSGAYGLTASPNKFSGQIDAKEILV